MVGNKCVIQWALFTLEFIKNIIYTYCRNNDKPIEPNAMNNLLNCVKQYLEFENMIEYLL